MNHRPPSNKQKLITLLVVAIGLVSAVATYYLRGFNEISFSGLPEGADEFQIVEYQGCGSLDQDSYPIVDGVVTMEWSYAIKTSCIRYRIVAKGKPVIEENHSFGPRVRHELELRSSRETLDHPSAEPDQEPGGKNDGREFAQQACLIGILRRVEEKESETNEANPHH